MSETDMLAAMWETVEFARNNDERLDETGPCSVAHFIEMYIEVRLNYGTGFSSAKTGRWLGFIQGVLVARGIATLDEMKDVCRRYAGLPPSSPPGKDRGED